MSRTKRNFPAKRWMRRPRTQQEIRENEGAELEGIKVRRKGKKKKPPTSWDDKFISARYETDHHTK